MTSNPWMCHGLGAFAWFNAAAAFSRETEKRLCGDLPPSHTSVQREVHSWCRWIHSVPLCSSWLGRIVAQKIQTEQRKRAALRILDPSSPPSFFSFTLDKQNIASYSRHILPVAITSTGASAPRAIWCWVPPIGTSYRLSLPTMSVECKCLFKKLCLSIDFISFLPPPRPPAFGSGEVPVHHEVFPAGARRVVRLIKAVTIV